MFRTDRESTFSLRRTLDGYEGLFHCQIEHNTDHANPFSQDMTEAEIAACVEKWLAAHSWESYPEVVLRNRAKRPDLIATKGPWVHVIECKKALGLPVIEQAMSRLNSNHNPKAGLPHLISVAIRRHTFARRSDFAIELLKRFGIGLIEVAKHPGRKICYQGVEEVIQSCGYTVYVTLEGAIIPGSRHLGKTLRAQLNPDTRIAVAGKPGNTGQYMTEWKRTMLRVESLIRQGGAYTTSEIVTHLFNTGGYHWCNKSSAISGINASLTRLQYAKEEYAHGNSHRWRWVDGKTKPVKRE
ncbi:hypothetical protein ACI0X9_003311 [Cronobacter turicensis]